MTDTKVTYTINADKTCTVKTTKTTANGSSSSMAIKRSYRCGDKIVPQSAEYEKNLGVYNKDFNAVELKKHNDLRAKHGAPPMVMDEKVARSAQFWTEKMVKENKMAHATKDQSGGCGENLAMSSQ